jgi:hypothetical protein
MKTVFQRLATVIFMFPLINIQNAALAAQSPSSLSGDYRLKFEQTSKTCGAKISPVDINVTLSFSESNVTMKFPRGFLGINILKAKFNPQTGAINDHLEQRVSLGPTEATLTLDIKGNLVNQDRNPEIRYDVSFDKTADDPAWNCKVTGKGQAKKL